MLHTLMQSPIRSDFNMLLLLLTGDDDLLLLQDGVLAAIQGNQVLKQLTMSEATLWVLEEDIIARGLSGQISTIVRVIGYTGFVMLTTRHSQQMVW